jgi:hypothetical protein
VTRRPSPAVLWLAAVVLFAPALAGAQPYAISWHTVDGGGATFSTGGPFSLGGTIGQPDASLQPMAGGDFGLVAGFWNLSVINQPPLLAAIGDRTVAEGANLSFTVSATDGDGDPITYSAFGLPPGATFDPATRTFSWTPDFSQAGAYPGVTFSATDPYGSDSEAITITVANTNQPPLLNAIGDRVLGETSTLTFTVGAFDPDGDTLTFSASALPPGATFDPATRAFHWTPTYTQSGPYFGVTFLVSDGSGGSDSEAITIIVNEVLVTPRGDFNGDLKPDLVWRQDVAGQNVVWFMNGVDLVSGTFTNPPVLADPRWKIVGTNDFNGDGQMDLLWRHAASGENVLWFLNGVDLVSGTFTNPAALQDVRWQMVGTGDFNLDARPDILWRHDSSGENVVWFMFGSLLTSGTFTTPDALEDVRWKMAGVADFDRDGRQDILWHHTHSGEAVLWYMNGTVLRSGTFTDPPGLPDVGWRMAAVGDYNADQKPDIVWRHQVSGQNVVWFMDDNVLISGTFTNPSTFPDVNWKLVGPR